MALLTTVIGRGTTAAKPAATDVPTGSIYYDTTLEKLQRTNGAAWEDCEPAAGLANPMDSEGDLIYGGAAGVATKLDAGATGYTLIAKGASAPVWEAQYSTLNFVIDGGGSEIADGIAGDLVVDFACAIVAWTLLADQSGAIKIDVWVNDYAAFPPTDADTICGGHEPEIAASGTNAQDTDLSDWIANPPTLAAGDCIRFNVDSCTTIERVTLALKVRRT